MTDRMTLWTAIAILPFALAMKIVAVFVALDTRRQRA
jgi:hypothetical protein